MNNAEYPQIAQDYEHAFAVWKAFPCDIFLGAHGSYYDMAAKYPKLERRRRKSIHRSRKATKPTSPTAKSAFQEELKKQQAAAGK